MSTQKYATPVQSEAVSHDSAIVSGQSLPAAAPTRVLIIDNVVGNMGDAAIVLAMQASFEKIFGPSALIECCYCGLTADPEGYAAKYPELKFVRALWNALCDWRAAHYNPVLRLLRKTTTQRFLMEVRLRNKKSPFSVLFGGEKQLFASYRNADVIVVTGGATLSSSWTAPALRSMRVAQYQLALALERPLVFYAHSFGPFTPEDTLPSLLRPIMERADAVLCRDAPSLETVHEVIGVTEPHVYQTIDEVMLLEPRTPADAIAPRQSRPIRIGICVHKWHWLNHPDPQAKQTEFEDRMVLVCQKLLERGDTELLFITSHQRFEGAIFEEEDVPERIRERLSAEYRDLAVQVHGFVHPQDFAYLMGQCTVVLSSRMHGCILSMVGGAPVVVLEYEPKTRGLMKQLDLEDCVLSMWDSPGEEILAKMQSFLEDPAEMRRRFAAGVESGRQKARRNRDITFDVVAKRQARPKP